MLFTDFDTTTLVPWLPVVQGFSLDYLRLDLRCQCLWHSNLKLWHLGLRGLSVIDDRTGSEVRK